MSKASSCTVVSLLVFAGGLLAGCAGDASPYDPGYYAEFCAIVEGFSTEERISSWEAFLLKYPSTASKEQINARIEALREGRDPEACPTPRPD